MMRQNLLKYMVILFAVFLLSQMVIVPAIGALTPADSSTNSTSLATNLTQNATSSTGTSNYDPATNCVHFDIRIPLPLLDQVSIFQFDLCIPQFLSNFTIIYDENGETDNEVAVGTVMAIIGTMIAALVLLGIVGGVAGYITGGNSNNLVAGFALAMVIGLFLVVLMAGIYPVFTLLPVLGFTMWLFTGVLGVLLTILTTLEMFTGG